MARPSKAPSPQTPEAVPPAVGSFNALDELEQLLVMVRDHLTAMPEYHVRVFHPLAASRLSQGTAFALSMIEDGRKYRGGLN